MIFHSSKLEEIINTELRAYLENAHQEPQSIVTVFDFPESVDPTLKMKPSENFTECHVQLLLRSAAHLYRSTDFNG